jgi:integrating conjugative element protein (TIGR03756 family)
MSRVSIALMGAVLLLAPSAQAGLITTPEIVAASASPACLDYQVVGVCIWLDCHPFGCDITVTPKICHYLPDVVVSSYHRSEQNPWVEMSPLSAAALGVGSSLMGGLLDGGLRTEGDGNRENKAMPFKEVSVIGNPAVGSSLISRAHLCPSTAVPFTP